MKQNKNGPKLITILLIIVIAAAVGANLFFGFRSFAQNASVAGSSASSTKLTPQEQQLSDARKEQSEKQRQDGGRISWPQPGDETGELSTVVVDSYDAIDVLQTVGDAMGIDAQDEYYVTNQTSSTDYTVYTLQQRFDGMDIYGYELKMKTDSYGNLLSVNGKHLDIPVFTEDIQYSGGDCEELVRRYLMQTYGLGEDDYCLENLGLFIVPYDESAPSRCYQFAVFDPDWDCAYERIFVDAMTGQISSDDFLDDEEETAVRLQGQTTSQNLTVWRSSDTRFELRSDEDNIRIAVANSSDISGYNDSTEIIWNPQQDVPNRSGVDALANLEKVYDFYDAVFHRNGITDNGDELYVVVDVNRMNGKSCVNNAAMTGTTRMKFGVRNDNSPTYAADLDVVGHETFHGITNADSSLLKGTYTYDRQDSVQLAIGEGLADVFGEFVEDYSNDNAFDGDCDWKLVSRSFHNTADASTFIPGQTDCHDGIPIICYPVYQLYSGERIGSDKTIDTYTLSQLYYVSMQDTSAQTDFKDFRRIVEDNALRMNAGQSSFSLSDAQLEGILDAMDLVNIDRSYTLSLTPGAALEVYNAENRIDMTYHITVTKKYGQQIVSEDVNSEKAYLDLPKGIYDVHLEDRETDLTYDFTLAMNDNSADQLSEAYKDLGQVFTRFESKKNNVVLVLDSSGSMDGTPISQTRKAAVNFVDTIFEMAPNVDISLVTYSESSEILLDRCSDSAQLKRTISNLNSGGGTDMYDGMRDGMLQLSNASEGKTIMVVMSDGLPNRGPDENGSYSEAVIHLADQIKQQGITVFSLGFFHNSTGSELTDGIALMEAIASEGYHYNVQDGGQIEAVFNEIGRQIGGSKYVYIRVDCPVNVTVSSGGEVLSSDPNSRNTSASFGSLTFEGEDESNNSKIFRLNADADYEVWIEGTGFGNMNVTVSYPNEESVYDDVRSFQYIPVTPGTRASMATARTNALRLDVDTDGDGSFDQTYRAGVNGVGSADSDNRLFLFHLIGILAVAGLMIFLWISRRQKFVKTMVHCPGCGRIPPKGSRFCEVCGRPYAAPAQRYRNSVSAFFKKRSAWVPQLIVIAVLLVVTSVHGMLYASSRQVLDRLESGSYMAARNTYRSSISGKGFTEQYTDRALAHYRDSVQEGIAAGTVKDTEDTRELIILLSQMIDS